MTGIERVIRLRVLQARSCDNATRPRARLISFRQAHPPPLCSVVVPNLTTRLHQGLPALLDRAFAVKYTVASYNGVQRLNCTKLSRGSRQEQTRLSVLSEKSATASEAVRRRWKPSSSSSSSFHPPLPPGLCSPCSPCHSGHSIFLLSAPQSQRDPTTPSQSPAFLLSTFVDKDPRICELSTRRSRSRERKHPADRTCRWIDERWNVPRGAALKSAVNTNVHWNLLRARRG